MRTPEDKPRSGREALIAVVCGALGGAVGGPLIPGGMGLLGPQEAGLGGILCFGSVGLLAGCVAAVLCVRVGETRTSLPAFENVLLSAFVGAVVGLVATLPLAAFLRDLRQGFNF